MKKSLLEKFPLGYELMPTDDLLAKIKKRTRSIKLKATESGWLARIRVKREHGGIRREYLEEASTPREALQLLDKRMVELGIYEDLESGTR